MHYLVILLIFIVQLSAGRASDVAEETSGSRYVFYMGKDQSNPRMARAILSDDVALLAQRISPILLRSLENSFAANTLKISHEECVDWSCEQDLTAFASRVAQEYDPKAVVLFWPMDTKDHDPEKSSERPHPEGISILLRALREHSEGNAQLIIWPVVNPS